MSGLLWVQIVCKVISRNRGKNIFLAGTCKELRNLRVLFVSPEDNALSSSSLTLQNPLFYS